MVLIIPSTIKERIFVRFKLTQVYLTVFLSKKWLRFFCGLSTLALALSSIPILFSKYSPTFSHTLQHSFFVLAILASAFLLITDKVVKSFQSIYNSIELGVFDKFQYTSAQTAMSSFSKLQNLENYIDKFQYTLAKKVTSLANTLRKSQTGDLNLNMLAIPIGFITIIIITILISF